MIGATTSQSLDLTLINKGDMVYGTSTIKVEIGLKIGSIIEYIPIGIYNIDDIEKTDYTIKITAFDNMIKFETPYFSTLGDTPTLQQVVNELSSKTGVQFVGSLPAYNVKKLEGFTCREILGYVASLCGGNAVITRDGKFTIVTPKDNSYSIGTANYIDYKREETKYKIGKVSCQAGEEVLSKGSLGTDSMELQFENPWINATILTDIYNKLNGFEYLGYSMKWQGDISLDVGDIVTITDKKGVVRKHPILSQKFTYTGGLTSEISAKGENKNKNEFSSSGPSAKKVERVVMELALINKALIDVAYIGDLTANNIKFDTASGGTLDLQSLLVKFVSGENGQYLNLTSSNVVIDNAVIKDLIAPNISVGDLKAGNIDSNRFNIVGSSGNLLIKDNTIQIKDSNRTRVQIGKDAANDYNMYVWDYTGKLMFDATGLKADGIKSKIIRDDMVSDTANINGSKINISSLITEVNKDNTQTLKASKIAFDSTGQSLEVSFNSLKSTADDTKSKTENNTTSINVINGQIDTLIKDTTIEENGTTVKLKDSYSSLKQTVGGLTSTVANHATSISTLGINVANANTLADSKAKVFTSTPTTPYKIGDLWVQGTSGEIMKCKVARSSGSYVATDWEKASKYTDDTKANAVEGNLNTLSGTVTTISNKQTSLEQSLDGFKTTVNNTYSTKTELSGVDGKVSSLTTRVNTVESSITQLNNKIALKVEATEVNSIVNNAVDDIEVGGRNLLKNTNFKTTPAKFINGLISINGDEITVSQNSTAHYGFVLLFSEVLTQGEEYILSLEIKTTSATPFDFISFRSGATSTNHGSPNGGNFSLGAISINGEYSKYTLKMTTSSNITNGLAIATINRGTSFSVRRVKFEKGTKVTDWTPAPEDVDQAISTVDSKVETVKNNVSQLTVDLTSITGRVSSTESTISSHTTQLGTVDTRINTAKTSAINTASTDATTKANNAKSGAVSDAKSYTDGQITTVNSTINTKVAEIKATTDSITSRVSSTESSITTINGSVSGLTTRVNSVEQSITATAITTTISSAINAGTSSITTTQFIMDKNGLAIKNGALTIKNKAGATVLTADTDGNLFVQNTLAVGGNTNGNIQVKNASNANIFTVSKNGVFLKDGTMKVTSGNVNWDGITYPSGGTKEMIVYSNGISINQLDYSGSQEYIHNGYYYSDGLRLVEDNRRNADGRYLETIINARGISTLSLILSDYSQDNTGYTPLPNGFILQWGNNAGLQSGWGTNFKIGFPNACLAVIPICTTHQIAIKVASKTKYNFVIDVGTTTGVGLNYLAIGY